MTEIIVAWLGTWPKTSFALFRLQHPVYRKWSCHFLLTWIIWHSCQTSQKLELYFIPLGVDFLMIHLSMSIFMLNYIKQSQGVCFARWDNLSLVLVLAKKEWRWPKRASDKRSKFILYMMELTCFYLNKVLSCHQSQLIKTKQFITKNSKSLQTKR